MSILAGEESTNEEMFWKWAQNKFGEIDLT